MDERRQHMRLAKGYRLEYGPFSSMVNHQNLKASTINDISGGGVSFCSEEQVPVGSQLFLKIYIAGWSAETGEAVTVSSEDSELLLMTIAEVLRADYVADKQCYLIGTRFLGRVHE